MAAPRIDYLAERPELVPQLAEWLFIEWFFEAGRTLDAAVRRLRGRMNTSRLPLGLVALLDDRPAGMCAVDYDELPGDARRLPCLMGLYVPPAERRAGIGAALCERAVAEARRLGFDELFLVAEERADYYIRLGWRSTPSNEARRDEGPRILCRLTARMR